MFSSEVLVGEGDRRRLSPRAATAVETDLRFRSVTTRTPCRITDISSGGARLMVYQDLSPDSAIRIALPGKGLVDAHVVWADGREAGLRFDQPLDAATLQKLLAAAS